MLNVSLFMSVWTQSRHFKSIMKRLHKNEIKAAIDSGKSITHEKTRRVIFSTVRGVYVVRAGADPALYEGADKDEAIRVWGAANDDGGAFL